MRRSGEKRVLALVLIGVLIVGGTAAGYLGGIEGVIGRVVAPVGQVFKGAGSGTASFFRFLGNVKDLTVQNAQLQNQVNDLKAQISTDREIQVQDDALRKELNFTQGSTAQLLPATIVAYQPDNFRAFITINRGTADGVKTGMAVVSDGALVGTISDVSATTAKVFLLIDPDFKVNGLDQTNASRANGTVQGQIGKGLTMTKIPQDQTVNPGDTVITSGLGGTVPKGLILGTVQSVQHSDNDVFQTAELSSPVQFNHLELVFVEISQ